MSTPGRYANQDLEEATRRTSPTDVARSIDLVDSGEAAGRSIIQDIHRWSPLRYIGDCGGSDQHWKDAGEFCSRLAGAVEERFIRNPSLELKDLLALPLEIADAIHSCPRPWQGCLRGGVRDYCPLHPASAQKCLGDLVHELDALNREMLTRAFEEGIGSGQALNVRLCTPSYVLSCAELAHLQHPLEGSCSWFFLRISFLC